MKLQDAISNFERMIKWQQTCVATKTMYGGTLSGFETRIAALKRGNALLKIESAMREIAAGKGVKLDPASPTYKAELGLAIMRAIREDGTQIKPQDAPGDEHALQRQAQRA